MHPSIRETMNRQSTQSKIVIFIPYHLQSSSTCRVLFILTVFLTILLSTHASQCPTTHHQRILVAGSLNLDTFLPLSRLPIEGENLTLLPGTLPMVDVPGGKGNNQAIACAKLFKPTSYGSSSLDPTTTTTSTTTTTNTPITSHARVAFLGQFGNDEAGTKLLRSALESHGVDIRSCGTCSHVSCGRGYVFIQRDTGKVSAVVSGGSNMYGWSDWEKRASHGVDLLLQDIMSHTKCLLLQREIPESVNLILARYAKRQNIVVLLDMGGEDRPIGTELLSYCDYIMPNASELKRLVESFSQTKDVKLDHDLDVSTVIEHVTFLQKHGANNVLVTLGDKGSILVDTQGNVLYQEALPLPDGMTVVDETGAGDCFRAMFAVGIVEGFSIKKCMELASAAGALAVTKEGAVPSIPDRLQVDTLLQSYVQIKETKQDVGRIPFIPHGGGGLDTSEMKSNEHFPFLFGSRLNSMKDRPDLWPNRLDSVRELVKRQATVRGIGCIDFNYPQHFHDWTPQDAKAALEEYGLAAGAVCLRYPSKFILGAMNHPDEVVRKEAIQMTKDAAAVARLLGAREVVVWSAFDGYDYQFQVDYNEKWKQIVEAFQECCDEYPDIMWSLEFKPTDENTRFFTIPSTGAALLLVKEINRDNMGLTLDFGHMIMAGENPGQSIAMVGEKLFGIQLNDGYTRLAAEDGMMFGSIHPSMALEVMYQLQRIKFKGHFYFDTFPQRSDPVKEAEYNIRKVKDFYRAAIELDHLNIREVMKNHDAIQCLEIINRVLYKNQNHNG